MMSPTPDLESKASRTEAPLPQLDGESHRRGRPLGRQALALWLMIAAGFCFATMGALIHYFSATIPWPLLALYRALFMLSITAVLLRRSGSPPLRLPAPPLLWLRSLAGTAGMLTTFYALSHLPVADATVVIETRPVWVALLAGLFLKERTGRNVWIYIVLGLAGVVLIEQPYFREGRYTVFVALGAAVAGAVAMTCLRALAYLDDKVIIAHFAATAAVAFAVYVAVGGVRPDADVIYATLSDPVNVVLLLGLGTLGTVGQLAMTKAFSLATAPRVAAVGLAKVGIAAAYDTVFWDRSFSGATLAGMGLILGSLWVFLHRRD